MNPRLFCRETSYHKTLLLTYSFDPMFFEQVVLPDLWAGRTSDIIVIGDRDQIEHSIQTTSGQLHHLGRNYVLAKANHIGAFHPKMTLRIGPKEGIVMIGSGNVTSSGWGGNQELGTFWKIGPDYPDKGGWLLTLLDDVLTWCDSKVDKDAVSRLKDVPWLSLTSTSNNQRAPVLHSHQGQALASQLASRWQGRQFDEVEIITGSTDESGEFLRWAHATFGIKRATVALTPSMASFQPASLIDLPIELKLIEAPSDRPLHAKFYWFKGGVNENAAVMGSANCSRAAWLNTPDRQGNIETIVVYDSPVRADFEDILSIFNGVHKSVEELFKTKESNEKQSSTTIPEYELTSLSWSRAERLLDAVLSPPPPVDARVNLLIDGKQFEMIAIRPDAGYWSCNISERFGNITVFAAVQIHHREQQSISPPRWIDDLENLEHASQSARLIEPFKALAGSSTSSEQRVMLNDLQEVARMLFHEKASFHDPSFTNQQRDKLKTEECATPITPQDVVLHLGKHFEQLRHSHSGDTETISIRGILRLLFESEGDHLTNDASNDEDLDEGQIPTEKLTPSLKQEPKIDRALIEEKFRLRLDQQISNFLSELSSTNFAENCTATQMVQAVSFPLAVALRGQVRGWVSIEQAEKWGMEVFSILFRRTVKGGLIHEVETRYKESDRQDIFKEVIGDGTLWLVLVATLGNAQWNGIGADVDKGIALREVFNATQLLASANQCRIGELLGRIRINEARKHVSDIAPKISGLFDQIEGLLRSVLDAELSNQINNKIRHKEGDLLWRDNAGWAICLEEADTRFADQVHVRLRGYDKRIARGYYINVTQLLSKLPDLNNLVTQLRLELQSAGRSD